MICKTCGEKFAGTVEIEGKRQTLWHRKECLNCQPYKTRFVKGRSKYTVEKLNEIQALINVGKTLLEISNITGYALGGLQRLSSEKRVKILSNKKKKEVGFKFKGHKTSEETKKKISEGRKKFLLENPDKVPYILNHKSKGPSYPEQYFLGIFKDLLPSVGFQHPVGLYRLDFVNTNTKVCLEIDGEQHVLDSRIVEHDKNAQ